MKRDWLIIPDFDRLSESLELSDRYEPLLNIMIFFSRKYIVMKRK